jgi:hypothetical protein
VTDRWWWFDFWAPTETAGGYAFLHFRPDENVAWYWAAFTNDAWPLVAVRAHDIRLPKAGRDIRTDALWASITDETVAMEAFGAVFEDPFEAWGDERGDVVPFGFDLEWDGEEVHGEVLVGEDRIDVAMRGSRSAGTGWPRSTAIVSPVKAGHVLHVLTSHGWVSHWE